MTRLAFVDCETTGLDPERNEVWEVGLILVGTDNSDGEYEWQLPVDLGWADAMALTVSGYHGRRVGSASSSPHEFARKFSRLTHGAHLVGAVPSFDDAFLKRLLRANGACPGWHYHLIDTEALVAGLLGISPPWNSNDLSKAVGVDSESFERHTALGDARWARATYDAVMAATR